MVSNQEFQVDSSRILCVKGDTALSEIGEWKINRIALNPKIPKWWNSETNLEGPKTHKKRYMVQLRCRHSRDLIENVLPAMENTCGVGSRVVQCESYICFICVICGMKEDYSSGF